MSAGRSRPARPDRAGGDPHERFEMVVGLEVHVQLATRTKAFCNCSTEFGVAPNTNTCPVCLGLPGSLPVLNAEAVELASRAALALGCTVHDHSVFARKNYFYPDLPKGYQITQYDRPLAAGGHLTIGQRADGSPIRIGITRLHLEEDAGKSLHDRFPAETAIDLNRAGVPLIEIVSEPDIRSAIEADAYLGNLKQILEYTGVSDVSMEEGSLRVDANISVRLRGESTLGTKTEIKNLNSFSAVQRSLDAEFARQVESLDRGEPIRQQTMLWDAVRGEVRPTRSKEEHHDYRYFPEPDLLPLLLDKSWLDAIGEEMPELPADRRARFADEYELPESQIVDLTATPARADYFESTARAHGDPRVAANWVLGEVLAALNQQRQPIEQFRVRPADLARLLDLVRDGVVSNTAAKKIFARMVETGDRPEQIAEREGLLLVRDERELLSWIDAVWAENPAEAERFAAGERKLQGVLVGKVMRKSNGRADPKRVNQLLESRAGT